TIVQKANDDYYLSSASSGTIGNNMSMGLTIDAVPSSQIVWASSGLGPAPVGVWTHLAATYDYSSRTMTFYVNGQAAGVATTAPAPGLVNQTVSELTIGNNLYGDSFKGLIDDVRIYNRALTPPEIRADMHTPVP